MKKTIELTPEWVLEKLPHTRTADDRGNVSVYTGNATDANWIELALDSLNIKYEAYEFINDAYVFDFGFDFRLELIEKECPNLYKSLRGMGDRNQKYNN